MKIANSKIVNSIAFLVLIMALVGCSTTSNLKDDEQLYVGMKPIEYNDYEAGKHFLETKAELEAALACAPNGALFGSSYYRTIPYGLWIYNACSDAQGALPRWIKQTFGKAPVIMADVNPELRVSVAKTVLQNNGYFRGDIDYQIIDKKIGKAKTDSVPRVLTTKLAYNVKLGPLFTIDSIEYVGFSDKELALIHSTPSWLKKDEAFSVSKLDQERNRIFNLFRDNGYYYFKQNYLTYMADTLQTPQRVQLQVCKLDSLPDEALRQWKIGKRTFRIRRQIMETVTDTIQRRSLTIEYAGEKPALRPGVVLQDIRLRPRTLFNQTDYLESVSRITSKGIFSSTDISFTPDASSIDLPADSIGSMNMLIDCILDKPYDFSMSANYTHKTSGRSGPGVGIGFAKRNAFRRGEILSLNLRGSADFQVGNKGGDNAASYDLAADVTLNMPRLVVPSFMKPQKRRRWYIPPSTLMRLSVETINRSSYFRRNIFSAELTYNFQPTEYSTHSFSPLTIDYTRLAHCSEEYEQKIMETTYGLLSLKDDLIPKMRYTYKYHSPASYMNPVLFTVTATEAGNVANALLCLGKKGWNDTDKKMVNAPVAQFVKLEGDFVKTWMTSSYSKLLFHAFAGYMHIYGNNDIGPFSENYYVGGANDLRGFASRTVGPGSLTLDERDIMYLISNGNMKLMCNFEYRPRIFGSLYGALFVDAGNVWDMTPLMKDFDEVNFKFNKLDNDIAVSAGFGIRYDLDFFVIRLDWGFILHAPYDTGHSGYFNTPSFKNAQCLNFAIGYPF